MWRDNKSELTSLTRKVTYWNREIDRLRREGRRPRLLEVKKFSCIICVLDSPKSTPISTFY